MPSDAAEEAFIEALAPVGTDPFLGVLDLGVDGEFRALTGEPIAPRFVGVEPNGGLGESCVIYWARTGQETGWADLWCDRPGQNPGAEAYGTVLCELPLAGRAFCGDGVAYPALGESCDDGNTSGGDGCPANCGATSGQPIAAGTAPGAAIYVAFDDPLPFAEARARCTSVLGHLATPTSGAENAALAAVVARLASLGAWLGFTDETVEAFDDATQFRSVVDDQPIGGGFENFPNGEPNDSSGVEDCAEIFAPGGTWNDQDCAALRPFVCEI
ncbi:MAG: hypothetical protein A2138_18325 [Deltaproteobacteria bacterium RBG_16_71_12]|nr:MAG: hypothetical protein A2138_18325 [Deltaproteobacteria bacterium RBG_16_71_12]